MDLRLLFTILGVILLAVSFSITNLILFVSKVSGVAQVGNLVLFGVNRKSEQREQAIKTTAETVFSALLTLSLIGMVISTGVIVIAQWEHVATWWDNLEPAW